jgi:putative ABC transport system permease protein
VTPGYFEALGIPLVEGRRFDAGDHETAAVVAVIDRELVKRHFPNENALGQRIRQTGAAWATIVGIVGDVHQEGLDIQPRANLYLAHAQSDQTWFAARSMTLLLRTGGEPLGLVSAVRRIVADMDSDLPVYEVTTMKATVARSTATERFVMVLQLVFAAVALALAAVGIYGVLSYSVAQQTQEIGIRMALGAERGAILRMVVGQGMVLVGISVVIGVVGALSAARILSTLLYGVTARDPITYVVVATGLAVVALLACWVPARRASGLSPQSALRYD